MVDFFGPLSGDVTQSSAFVLPATSMSTMTLTLPSHHPAAWPDGRKKWRLNSGKGFAYLSGFADSLPRAVVLNVFVCAGLFGVH